MSNPLLHNGPFGWPCLNLQPVGGLLGFMALNFTVHVVSLGFYYG